MTSLRDFGWWMESTDEDLYGPVTRANLQRFLQEGAISPNTSVRHCTDAEFKPAADHGLTDGLGLGNSRRTGDDLAQAWPRKGRDQRALAESDIECAYHRRPAVLSCIRCLAPYCFKCRMKKGGKTFFMCKKCHSKVFNRRFGAYIVDGVLLSALPVYGIGLPLTIALGETGASLMQLLSFGGTALFMVRDPLFNGAGPGKRLFGLHVVTSKDGVTRLSYGQGLLRNLAHLVPVFNLFDASRGYSDPYHRRYGDQWAGTRVLDSASKLLQARVKVRDRLQRKGVTHWEKPDLDLPQFAQLEK